MSKGRNPRKRRDDAPKEIEREAATPGQALLPAPPVAAQTPAQPVLFQVSQAVRLTAEAIVDLADAVADAITKRVEGRA